jgi:micrococcal nuclease
VKDGWSRPARRAFEAPAGGAWAFGGVNDPVGLMGKSKHPARLSPAQRRLRRVVRRAAWAAGIVAVLGLLALADRAGVFGRRRQPDWPKYHGRPFKVARIVDGDTLDVACPDGRYDRTRVRLLGVDTPESIKPDTPVQHFGPESTAFLRERVLGRTVTLELDYLRTRDIHNRLLAYVIGPGGENINEAIIATGHGYADPRFRHPLARSFGQAQKQAMQQRRGLWEDATDADLPYYYRGKLKLPPATAGPGTFHSPAAGARADR